MAKAWAGQIFPAGVEVNHLLISEICGYKFWDSSKKQQCSPDFPGEH
jgi:hypothetical protein